MGLSKEQLEERACDLHVKASGHGPMPEYESQFRPRWPGDQGSYTALQMVAYAASAVAAERDRWRVVLRAIADTPGYGAAGPSASGWVHWQEQARQALSIQRGWTDKGWNEITK